MLEQNRIVAHQFLVVRIESDGRAISRRSTGKICPRTMPAADQVGLQDGGKGLLSKCRLGVEPNGQCRHPTGGLAHARRQQRVRAPQILHGILRLLCDQGAVSLEGLARLALCKQQVGLQIELDLDRFSLEQLGDFVA